MRPLDDAQKCKMIVNHAQLLSQIDLNHSFITELANSEVISWPQREHIVNILQPRDRLHSLLELLTRGSVASFNKFIKVLSNEQEHIVPLLLTDGG